MFKQNIETEDARFFPRDGLPELSINRNTKHQIDMCYDYIESGQNVTIFD
jgi:hypothetical protein